MRKNDLNTSISEEFERFKELWVSNEWWGAVLSLASIYNCLCSISTSTRLKNIWLPKIIKPSLEHEVVDYIHKCYIERYQRIDRILSIGDRFNDDEFLLIFTYHAEILLIKDYLDLKEIEHPQFDLNKIEETVKKMGRIKKNQRDFNIALSQIKNNWGLPITTVWTI